MKNSIFYTIAVVLISFAGHTQVILNADGPDGPGTYELITKTLAPGTQNGAVEAPDAIHPSFGRHITEVYDNDLKKYVFEFHLHVSNTPPDNEPVKSKTDRQRVEIKSFEPSPDDLKGINGETVQYKWRFKIPAGFKPTKDFTHIHQIKAVDGDAGNPLFTLTLRKMTNGSNQLELIYVKDEATKMIKYQTVDISLFEGNWVEATETIKVGRKGTYTITIKKVDNGTVLMKYSNSNIQTIRADNSFIRPKWGMYRSLKDSANMKDETMRFSDFSIQELTTISGKDN
ncbi:heparin lyase I family protein [Flavobacterium aquidurense]|uniref:heparin lyase I family protein n=1 Tax=Flavobacterium aquidurense TaxID=362413 RepID=UPI00375818CE